MNCDENSPINLVTLDAVEMKLDKEEGIEEVIPPLVLSKRGILSVLFRHRRTIFNDIGAFELLLWSLRTIVHA
jgi:hypothetical protein